MSLMVQCNECRKLMYTDSSEDKGAYINLTAYDPLHGYSTFHLCRKCFEAKFPWLSDRDEEDS